MRKFIVFILLLYSFNAKACDDRYYIKLASNEKIELQTIKRNYHRYGDELKKIANKRATEIKIKLLPIDKQVELRDNLIFQIQGNSGNVKNVIDNRRAQYVKLPKEIRYSLIKYSMKLLSKDELSDIAIDYLSGKNLLINDNTSTVKK